MFELMLMEHLLGVLRINELWQGALLGGHVGSCLRLRDVAYRHEIGRGQAMVFVSSNRSVLALIDKLT